MNKYLNSSNVNRTRIDTLTEYSEITVSQYFGVQELDALL